MSNQVHILITGRHKTYDTTFTFPKKVKVDWSIYEHEEEFDNEYGAKEFYRRWKVWVHLSCGDYSNSHWRYSNPVKKRAIEQLLLYLAHASSRYRQTGV